jgi:predicted nuclease of predicted toxin-antitoxin system
VSALKFLIDENLSVALPALAHMHGFESAHVAHRGLHQWKDWSLLDIIVQEDWVLVTNNAVEFRGRLRRVELHPGVVFLVPSVRRSQQLELFAAALDELERDADLVNTALDVVYDGDEIVLIPAIRMADPLQQ